MPANNIVNLFTAAMQSKFINALRGDGGGGTGSRKALSAAFDGSHPKTTPG